MKIKVISRKRQGAREATCSGNASANAGNDDRNWAIPLNIIYIENGAEYFVKKYWID